LLVLFLDFKKNVKFDIIKVLTGVARLKIIISQSEFLGWLSSNSWQMLF